jgi:hypothetical protein
MLCGKNSNMMGQHAEDATQVFSLGEIDINEQNFSKFRKDRQSISINEIVHFYNIKLNTFS